MLKTFVRAAVVTAALVAIPAASQAGSRGDGARECHFCKMFSHTRERVASVRAERPMRPLFTRDMFKLPPRDPLFKLAPREARVAPVRTERVRRPLFTRDMFKLPPRDPLFKLAPREERVSHVRAERPMRPLFTRTERAPLAGLFNRAPRAAHVRGDRR